MKQSNAFSLIEITIAFTAMCFMTILAFEGLKHNGHQCRRAHTAREKRLHETASMLFRFDHNGKRPSSIQALEGEYLIIGKDLNK